MMRSGNPALKGEAFRNTRSFEATNIMTIQGAVNKTLVSLGIAVLGAWWAWSNVKLSSQIVLPAAILGFIIAIITIFKKEWAPVTTPVYSLVEGVLLGGVSLMFEAAYPGIVIQAITLTFGILFCLLIAYKSRLIKVTENFKLGVIAATGGIALIYIISFIMGFFGARIPFIHEGGLIGILFSLFVVVIASLNLVLDFDFIERGAEYGAPRYMEWYAAFSLILTLVWLYLEILRLLAKTRSR